MSKSVSSTCPAPGRVSRRSRPPRAGVANGIDAEASGADPLPGPPPGGGALVERISNGDDVQLPTSPELSRTTIPRIAFTVAGVVTVHPAFGVARSRAIDVQLAPRSRDSHTSWRAPEMPAGVVHVSEIVFPTVK